MYLCFEANTIFFVLFLYFMWLVWKIAIFTAKLHLANSNCSWFTMDASLRWKLDICLDWAIAFHKPPLERTLMLPWKRWGVSKLAKITFFLEFWTSTWISNSCTCLKEWVRVHVFHGFFACFLTVILSHCSAL